MQENDALAAIQVWVDRLTDELGIVQGWVYFDKAKSPQPVWTGVVTKADPSKPVREGVPPGAKTMQLEVRSLKKDSEGKPTHAGAHSTWCNPHFTAE